MSVELLAECKRKLITSLNKLDKTVQMFDSEPLERSIYETCRAEAIVQDTRQSIHQAREELTKYSNR